MSLKLLFSLRSSMVERRSVKPQVAGSIPVEAYFWEYGGMVDATVLETAYYGFESHYSLFSFAFCFVVQLDRTLAS